MRASSRCGPSDSRVRRLPATVIGSIVACSVIPASALRLGRCEGKPKALKAASDRLLLGCVRLAPQPERFPFLCGRRRRARPGLRDPHRRERRRQDQPARGRIASRPRPGAARRAGPPASPASGIEIGTGIVAGRPERRQVLVNGAPAAANSLSDWLSVLWLTPAMDRLFTDAASGRRRFVDRLALALHPGHAG